MNSPKNQKETIGQIEYIDHDRYGSLPPDERKLWAPVKVKYEKVPMWSKISLIIAIVSILLFIIICINKTFADFFNTYISGAFRFLLAKITDPLPFSFAESLIILIPVILFIAIWYMWKYRCNTSKSTVVSIICIVSIASMFLSSFVLLFSAGYRGNNLAEKLDIKTPAIDKYDLYLSAEYLVDEINEITPEIYFAEDGFSKMPYSFSKMNDELISAYDKFCKDYDFIHNFKSKLKPVLLSKAMSYAHITGIYTFFTGESNVNVDFPDYTIPFTAAHELAHQRGIAREDEANMIAFLVCIRSDDAYIRYCAYVNMYEYIAAALYKADKELFKKVDKKLNKSVYNEQVAYSAFFDQYEKSVTSQISGTVNDVYLKAQGTAGKKSYGMVVDLTVAYFKKNDIIEK